MTPDSSMIPDNDQTGPVSAPTALPPPGYVGGSSYDLVITCNESGEQVSITGSGIQSGVQTHTCGGAGSEIVNLILQQDVVLDTNILTINSKDEYDNPAGATTSVNFSVDTEGPTVVINSGDITEGEDATFEVSVTDNNLPSSWNYTPTISPVGVLSPTSCTTNPCNLTVTGANAGSLTLTVPALEDSLTNSSLEITQTITVSVNPSPRLVDVLNNPLDLNTNDWLEGGEELLLSVTFSEVITITGTPRIPVTLDSGVVYAMFDPLVGTAPRVKAFRLTVASGDEDCNGTLQLGDLDLNGGTLTDSHGKSIETFAFPSSATSVSGVKIDAVAPVFSSLSHGSDAEVGTVGTDKAATITWEASDSCSTLSHSMSLVSIGAGQDCSAGSDILDFQSINPVIANDGSFSYQPVSGTSPFNETTSPITTFVLIENSNYCSKVKVEDEAGNMASDESLEWTATTP